MRHSQAFILQRILSLFWISIAFIYKAKGNHMDYKTSITHPIRIDSISALPTWGLIGMSFCPGKTQTNALSGNWVRNLNIDLERIRDWGATIVVTLMEAHELKDLKVEALPQMVEIKGMRWMHLPIKDQKAPDSKFMADWSHKGNIIKSELLAGNNVFIHCKGGLGRTGTIAACLLIEAGADNIDSITKIRSTRSRTIETKEQENFVIKYKAIL